MRTSGYLGMVALTFYHLLGTGDVHVLLHVTGLIRLDRDSLFIEWQASRVEHLRSPQKWTRGEVQQLVVPLASIESVSYKPRWLSAGTLTIRAFSLTTLQALPGAINAFWSVKVHRSERARARELTGESSLRLANQRLHELESGEPR
ncbi:MAG: hypothetical protein JWM95_5620 [Gemmatimonadetes bacterium]|nr:hypothetical protein [Gemmatimonadota bacterium]